MTDDSDDYEPGALVEYEGEFSFVFGTGRNNLESAVAVFEEMGYTGNGYTWDAVVDALIRMHASDLVDKLDYTSEGGMFCVESTDPEALKIVAQLLRKALQDTDLLREAIKNADKELF